MMYNYKNETIDELLRLYDDAMWVDDRTWAGAISAEIMRRGDADAERRLDALWAKYSDRNAKEFKGEM